MVLRRGRRARRRRPRSPRPGGRCCSRGRAIARSSEPPVGSATATGARATGAGAAGAGAGRAWRGHVEGRRRTRRAARRRPIAPATGAWTLPRGGALEPPRAAARARRGRVGSGGVGWRLGRSGARGRSGRGGCGWRFRGRCARRRVRRDSAGASVLTASPKSRENAHAPSRLRPPPSTSREEDFNGQGRSSGAFENWYDAFGQSRARRPDLWRRKQEGS